MEQAVALVACLVWREKSDGAPRISEDMEGPVAALREAARRVAKVCPPCPCTPKPSQQSPSAVPQVGVT